MGSPVNVGKIDTTVHTSGFISHVHIKVSVESFNYTCIFKIIFKISKTAFVPYPPLGYLDESYIPLL